MPLESSPTRGYKSCTCADSWLVSAASRRLGKRHDRLRLIDRFDARRTMTALPGPTHVIVRRHAVETNGGFQPNQFRWEGQPGFEVGVESTTSADSQVLRS